MAFQTTLIIGLGGIGSSVVEGIYRKFMASDPSEIDKDNVAFLCLDTDEADIRKRRKVMPANSVVKTSSDLSDTVGGYIARIQNNTTVLDWFDTRSEQMLTMPLNEGAAQIRMASRLAAMSAINEGKFAAIDKSITNLLATDPARHQGNNIKIHIISSLAGGTGAGSFLQVAYYVKDAMRAHGALAPKITGYFVLADVLCDEMGSTFSKDQKENVRSNTYACIKELMAFCDKSRRDGLRPLLFEYKLGQRDKSLPPSPPYDTCFLIDYTGVNGGNLKTKDRYYDQATQFVYTNAFDPVGDNFRSMAINDVRQLIDNAGASRYASFGVSKLVYPVDDLMAYFSGRRVYENLSGTWLRIDNDFLARWAEYKKSRSEGIPATQPDRGVHFREQVDSLAKNGSGKEGAEFRQVLQETKMEISEEGKPFMVPKAQLYLENVERFVIKVVTDNAELNGLYAQSTVSNPEFISRENKASDLDFVVQREVALEDYLTKVIEFIDNTKAFAVRQCLVADHDAELYVSNNPTSDLHHLNSYILEKDNEMHPLAVRYFLYEVQLILKNKLAEKKGVADKLEKQIKQGYAKSFDNPETNDLQEGPGEILEAALGKHSGLKKIINSLSGQNPYKATKTLYAKKSKKQATDIQKYSTERLLADTYAGLLNQVNLLIEESEAFFKSIPAAMNDLKESTEMLLHKHDFNDDPAVSFVLASAQIKKEIYEKVISANDSPFFPSEMSASLYRSMYHNMVQKLDTGGFKLSRKQSQRELEQAALDANKKIIEECVSYQDRIIRENNVEYARKNVMTALHEEAMYEWPDNPDKIQEYMRRRFTEFRDRAEIWGPADLGTEVRYINAWGLHPDCLEALPQELIDELLGATNVGTTDTNAATRIASEQFDRSEILRVNAVTLLTIEKHFKKFLYQPASDLTYEEIGNYFQAYKDVVTKMAKKNSRTYSPHLDKHWHLPAYMPNIGQTASDEAGRIFKALYSGLLFGCFFAVSSSGDYYWKYRSAETLGYIKDSEGGMIPVGKSQPYALERLFKDGLSNNPNIVDEVLSLADKKWAELRDDWHQRAVDEESELAKMKTSSAARLIDEFRFNICSLFPAENNWFTLLDSRSGMELYKALEEGGCRSAFYDDLIEHLIDIFGPSTNTRKLCDYLFKRAGKRFIDEATVRLNKYEADHRFQPEM